MNPSLAIVSLLLVIVTGVVAVVVENAQYLELSEIEKYRVIPQKKRGALTARNPPTDECKECTEQTRLAIDRFNQFTYFRFFKQKANVTNSYELAGIKTCREVDEALDCYKQCYDGLSEPVEKKPREYASLQNVKYKFCEDPESPSHPSCRLADVRGCDLKYRQNECGDQFEQYKACINDTLYFSGQDCSGLCTPARRYSKIMTFTWDMHCGTKKSLNTNCGLLMTFFCFQEVKDTDTNYGIYEKMNEIEDMKDDLDKTCSKLQSPFECIDTLTYGRYVNLGYNETEACISVEDNVNAIKSKWGSLIDPFCGESRPEGATTVAEACPAPGPTDTPPVIDRSRQKEATTARPTWKTYQPKHGKCPKKHDGGICGKKCGDDSHCEGDKKCCDGCCREPLLKRSNGRKNSNADEPLDNGGCHLAYSGYTLLQLIMASLLTALVSMLD